MCYNCGCGMPEDDMGKGHIHKGGGSLTEETIEHLAKEWGMKREDVLKNIRDEVTKQLGGK